MIVAEREKVKEEQQSKLQQQKYEQVARNAEKAYKLRIKAESAPVENGSKNASINIMSPVA